MKAMLTALAIGCVAAAAGAPDTAENWLERIEARADKLDTLRASIVYTSIQGLLGDEQTRIGTLIYDDADADKNTPARFAVRFDSIVVDGALQMQDRSYTFDGTWLGEKIEDHGRKVYIRRQLARGADRSAGAEPADKPDPLSLGDGPFALPLNLRKDQVLRRYEVTVIEPGEDDPAGAVHLRLIPRPGVNVDQQRIDLWFDRETLLPVRAATLNHDESESIVVLRKPVVNPPVGGETFDTTPPRGDGWQIEVKPLKSDDD